LTEKQDLKIDYPKILIIAILLFIFLTVLSNIVSTPPPPQQVKEIGDQWFFLHTFEVLGCIALIFIDCS